MSDKILILCWKEPELREWIPVGRLWQQDNQYFFCYTQGLKKAQQNNNFTFLGEMTDAKQIYFSDELFPVFQNRLLAKSRPEYKRYLDWIGLEDNLTKLDELARTNGIRATDSLQLFEIPKINNGKYTTLFFSHGISHLPESYLDRIETVKEDEKLYLMQDIQNKVDRLALMLRTDDPVELMGYCPRIYTKDINRLLVANDNEVKVTVKKVNETAPLQVKLLCQLEAKWPAGFSPFDDEEFKPFSG